MVEHPFLFNDSAIIGSFPLTPAEAAQAIITHLLADLAQDRKDAVAAAIEEWGYAWGDHVQDSIYGSLRG